MAARKPARRSAGRRPAPRPKARAPRRAKAARPRAKTASKSVRPRRVAAKATARRLARPARKATAAHQKKSKPASKPRAKLKTTAGKSLLLKKKSTPPRVKSRPVPAPVIAKTRPARPAPAPKAAPHHPAHPPTLSRERRRLSDLDLLDPPRIQSEVDVRAEAAAHSGGVELQHAIERHTEAGPGLTAGDLDARWDDAYAVGDEAPGGDNPTPDQDRVDDIGKALGVVYREGEELQGSDKIAERDAHRWELDPASSDDWPHKP